MLHGSNAEKRFGEEEARSVIMKGRTLHFQPGTRYSYANQNFRILSDILEDRTERKLDDLFRLYLFERAGMDSARISPETNELAGGTIGYEGNPDSGFRPAINRINWTGDAGISASLSDMIAWERHIDLTRDDPISLYRRLSVPITYSNGREAAYGFGLYRRVECGRAVSGHAGALRGWRAHRLHVASERISVVVLFNHEADAQAAAFDILAATLGEDRASPNNTRPSQSWMGSYLEPETSLAIRVALAPEGGLRMRCGHINERLDLTSDTTAVSFATSLRLENENIWMERRYENQHSHLIRQPDVTVRGFAGEYYCTELNSRLSILDAGNALYGSFSGFLGRGNLELLEPIGPELWTLPCRRALDSPAPGEWSLRLRRDNGGKVVMIVVGCVLARGLQYIRNI